MTEASIHRYPANEVVADYARALAGLVLTLGPLAVFNVLPVMVYILGGLGALFLAFGFRTLLRHMTHVEVSAEGIRMDGPAGRTVRWRELDGMALRFYATRRDRRDGWMQLKLKADGGTLTLDSSLDGFSGIVQQALRAACANGVPLEARTLANLPGLGIAAPGDDAASAGG